MSNEEILNLWDCNKITCGEVIESARADERKKVLYELNNKIEEKLKEPQYQHDGEDWQVGLIIAQDVLNELKEQKNEVFDRQRYYM